QTLDLYECKSLFLEIVGDIQVKIAEFEENKHADVKDECEKLITHILEEKEKHKECYTKGFPYPNLVDNEHIKSFYRICNAKTNCNFISPQYIELIKLKDDTEISCKSDQDSVIKNVKEPKGNAGEGASQPNVEDPKIITPETIPPQRNTHKSNSLNCNALDWQAVGSQTDEDHLSVDKDIAVFSTTEYRAAKFLLMKNLVLLAQGILLHHLTMHLVLKVILKMLLIVKLMLLKLLIIHTVTVKVLVMQFRMLKLKRIRPHVMIIP
ncbi:CYIR protein, partial [Plasmodium cynomolgi strain B]